MALFANGRSIAAYSVQLLVDEFLAETEVRNLLASAETLEVKREKECNFMCRNLGGYIWGDDGTRAPPPENLPKSEKQTETYIHVSVWLVIRQRIIMYPSFPRNSHSSGGSTLSATTIRPDLLDYFIVEVKPFTTVSLDSPLKYLMFPPSMLLPKTKLIHTDHPSSPFAFFSLSPLSILLRCSWT